MIINRGIGFHNCKEQHHAHQLDDCPYCRIRELEAQLSANKETVRLLIDRWNEETGEWLDADDCAYELKQALEEMNDE